MPISYALVASVAIGCSATSGSKAHGGGNAAADSNAPTPGTYRLYTDFSVSQGAMNSLSYQRAIIATSDSGPTLQLSNACQGLCTNIVQAPRNISLTSLQQASGTCQQVFQGSDDSGSVQVTDNHGCGSIQSGLLNISETSADGATTNDYASDDIVPNDALGLGFTFRLVPTSSARGAPYQIDFVGGSGGPYSALLTSDPNSNPQTVGTDFTCDVEIDSVSCQSNSSGTISVTRGDDGQYSVVLSGSDQSVTTLQPFAHVRSQ